MTTTKTFRMDIPVEELPGVGDLVLKVFERAGFTRVGDVYSKAAAQPLQDALRQLRAESDAFRADDAYWKSLATRVRTVVGRVRNADAKPYEPHHFLCPITLSLMSDPVLSKYGDTYERSAIERWIREHGTDIYRRPLTTGEMFDNRALREAIEYYEKCWMQLAVPIAVARQ